MPLIQTAVQDLWIADHRSGDGNPVALIIHGAGGSHLSFPAEIRKLRGVDPVVVDLCGHGKSPGAGHDSIARYARNLAALLDALEIESAVVIGHSMGGAIAQCFALEYPGRVLALVLLATAAKFQVNQALIGGIVADADGTIDILDRWLWRPETPPSTRRQAVEIMRATDPAVFQRDLIACERFNASSRLHSIRSKTLILAGEDDKMTSLALGQELEHGIAEADFISIPGGSHMFMLEEAEATADAIESWLGTIL